MGQANDASYEEVNSTNRVVSRLLAGSTEVRAGEGRPVLAAGLLFFILLMAVMILRPVREALGPAQETLFTVVDRQEKYKAKSFLDTFGYRAGDATGAALERLLASFGPGMLPLASAVLGLAAVWLWLAVFLGRTQRRFAPPQRQFAPEPGLAATRDQAGARAANRATGLWWSLLGRKKPRA